MFGNVTVIRCIVPCIPSTKMFEGYGPAIPLLPKAGMVIEVEFEKVAHPGLTVGVGLGGVGVGLGVCGGVGVGVPPQSGQGVGWGDGDAVGLAVGHGGEQGVGVGGGGNCTQYRAPSAKLKAPFQMIISLPVQTAA